MTKITYNGKTTELADGYIATLPCKDLKMETDVVVEAPEGSGGANVELQEKSVTNTQNGTTEVTPDEGKALSKVTIITAVQSSGDDVEFKIVVAVDSGATVTATKGSTKVSGTSVNGTCTLIVPEEGTWTVTATIDGVSATAQTVVVSSAFDTQFDYDKAILTIVADAGAVVTCSKGDITHTKTIVDEPAIFTLYSFGEWALSATFNGLTKTDSISVAAGSTYTKDMSSGAVGALALASWETISEVSAEGTAANYWAVGDAKTITINGTVGTKAISGNYKVYIIGFDHNSEIEGNGIHFGTFKTEDDIYIALADDYYGQRKTDGTKAFSLHHWDNQTGGGWSRSDVRYDILGSVNVASSKYGTAQYSSSVAYDATGTCATNPVADTLMAALPADLRAVMKPMTKYTDNLGGGTSGTEASVTATIDYLPLLSEFEVTGETKFSNPYEANKQKQYAYFLAGNEKNKYKHNGISTHAYYMFRSIATDYRVASFYHVSVNQTKYGGDSQGIAPIFKV